MTGYQSPMPSPTPPIISNSCCTAIPTNSCRSPALFGAPVKKTPVHNHTVWGVIGMLRGSETCKNFEISAEGTPLLATDTMSLQPQDVTVVSPSVGDIHEVGNSLADRPSISFHAYGANIGAVSRHVFDPDTGKRKPFVSGYANTEIPNIWDRSKEVREALLNGAQ